MSDSTDPQTNDDTFVLDGNVTSVAVEAIGSPSVIFWLKNTDGGIYQFNGSLVNGDKPPAPPRPALGHGAYVGRFQNDYFGDLEIAEFYLAG